MYICVLCPQDLQRYCIACYSRSLQQRERVWREEVWDGLVEAVTEVATNCLLQELVEGIILSCVYELKYFNSNPLSLSCLASSIPTHNDLWSDIYKTEGSKVS